MRGTKEQVLEAAGRVFAERGFEAATGKEICARAGVASAAVNYHFGGMRALYDAALVEARARLVSLDALVAAANQEVSAEAKVRAIVAVACRAARSSKASWEVRLLTRALLAPAQDLPAFDAETLRRARLLAEVVGEYMGLPSDQSAVAHACLSLIGPFLLLLLVDGPRMGKAFPSVRRASDEEEVLRHMADFALAGLDAVALTARNNRSPRAASSTEANAGRPSSRRSVP